MCMREILKAQFANLINLQKISSKTEIANLLQTDYLVLVICYRPRELKIGYMVRP